MLAYLLSIVYIPCFRDDAHAHKFVNFFNYYFYRLFFYIYIINVKYFILLTSTFYYMFDF